LNFFDITIIKKDNLLITDWYQKLTFSGRYLNYFSHYPLCQKIGTILSLVDRVLLLSHPEFQKNFEKVIKILIMNGYPLNCI